MGGEAHKKKKCDFPSLSPQKFYQREATWWPPAVESSIAVEDAVENRGLYRIFASCLF